MPQESTVTVSQMHQGTELQALKDFAFRVSIGAKPRKIQVRKNEKFWVTNTTIDQKATGLVRIHRVGTGHTSTGYPFTLEQLLSLFTPI